MGDLRKPEERAKRKLYRIFVEWICERCDEVHRVSFVCSFKSLSYRKGRGKGIMLEWSNAYRVLTKVKLEPETTLSELNDFLNSLFYSRFNAKKYVKICYPKKLIKLLTENERRKKDIITN